MCNAEQGDYFEEDDVMNKLNEILFLLNISSPGRFFLLPPHITISLLIR